MRLADLKHVIREVGERTGLDYFFIIGSAAVLASLPKAADPALVATSMSCPRRRIPRVKCGRPIVSTGSSARARPSMQRSATTCRAWIRPRRLMPRRAGVSVRSRYGAAVTPGSAWSFTILRSRSMVRGATRTSRLHAHSSSLGRSIGRRSKHASLKSRARPAVKARMAARIKRDFAERPKSRGSSGVRSGTGSDVRDWTVSDRSSDERKSPVRGPETANQR